MQDLGEFFGFVIIGLFLVEAFRFILKIFFKKYGNWVKRNTKYHPILLKIMNLNRIYHPWIGYIIIILIGFHVYIQTGFLFFHLTGFMAGSLMTIEIIVGFFGEKVMKKPRPNYWIWVHRLLPIAVIIAILNHI